jgi:hypothetical protein
VLTLPVALLFYFSNNRFRVPDVAIGGLLLSLARGCRRLGFIPIGSAGDL